MLLPELTIRWKKDDMLADPRIIAAIKAGKVTPDSTKAELIAAQ